MGAQQGCSARLPHTSLAGLELRVRSRCPVGVRARWVVCVLIAAFAVAGVPGESVHAKCGRRWSFPASASERQGIEAAVRRRSRARIVDVRWPPPSENAPPGALEVVTLLWGTCDGGGGELFWVVESAKGWRTLKGKRGWAVIH